MKLIKEFKGGKLYEANGFLIPVVSGDSKEMGNQYGMLMVDAMNKTWNVLFPQSPSQNTLNEWKERAYGTCSLRNRLWYDGVAEGTGWPLDKVCLLDQLLEFGMYQAKLYTFAGCSSILAWGEHSKGGTMFTGRNMDWNEKFNMFPQTFTVRKPTDGSYKIGTLSWPGVSGAFTAINEKGVYFDMHDGSSMGGSLISLVRPSILNVMIDNISEASSLQGLISRLNGTMNSTSCILSLADPKGAACMECSSLAGNRLRLPEGQCLAVTNSHLLPDWGLGKRETVSNSLRRYSNAMDRLKERNGKVNAAIVREILDMRLFNVDGSFAENGGFTKPTNQDADLTNHQIVTDGANFKVWLKVPVPDYFADWTEIDLMKLWA